MRQSIVLVVSLAALAAAPARAEPGSDVDRCLAAHEGGQKAEQDEQLVAARQRYLICSASACPAVVQKDCKKRLADLEATLPSLSVSVLRGGRALGEVTITVDGEEVSSANEPMRLEPGDHLLRVTAPDGATLERRLSLRRGEHRELELELPRSTEKAPEHAAPAKSSKGVLPYVLGGVAVAGFAGFAGFALAGKSKQAELEDCKPNCKDTSLYDDMKRRYLFADISLAIGIAAGVGTYLVISAGGSPDKHGANKLQPSVLRLGGRF